MSDVGCSTNQFCFWFLDSFFWRWINEVESLEPTRNVAPYSEIHPTVYVTAWLVSRNLEIAYVLWDYDHHLIKRNHFDYSLTGDTGMNPGPRFQCHLFKNKRNTARQETRSLNVQTVKKISEYDQEIPQSYTADQPTALLGRATESQNTTSHQTP